jgi:hypothetical protein
MLYSLPFSCYVYHLLDVVIAAYFQASVVSGYDLIEWLMERLNIEESGKKYWIVLKFTIFHFISTQV